MTDGEVYAYIQKYCYGVHVFEEEYTWTKKVITAIRHWKPALSSYQSAAEFISNLKGRKKEKPILVYTIDRFKIYLNKYFPEIKNSSCVMEVE